MRLWDVFLLTQSIFLLNLCLLKGKVKRKTLFLPFIEESSFNEENLSEERKFKQIQQLMDETEAIFINTK